MCGRLARQKGPTSGLPARGFGVLDMLVALTVSVSLISFGSKYAAKQTDELINQTTAQQLSRLATALKHYAHDNFASLQEETKNGHPVVWDSQKIEKLLKDGGYLSITLPIHNPYQQSYQVVIQQQKSEQQPEQPLLQLVLLTQEGQTIRESSLRQISQWAGPSSGYISHLNPKQVSGSLQGWELSELGGVAMPAPGHLAALNYLHANDVLSGSSLLFRKKIDGHPEYNRMDTDLQMEANIELEDGTKIVFNQKDGRTTVIEARKIELNTKDVAIKLGPERLTVDTAQGVSGYRGIETNSHVMAAGDVDAGRDLIAGCNIKAGRNIFATRDVLVNGNISTQGLNVAGDIDVQGNLRLGRDTYTSKVPLGYLGGPPGELKYLVNNQAAFGGMTEKFIKIPFYEIQKQTHWFYKIGLCNNDKSTEGRMYMIRENVPNSYIRLVICMDGKEQYLNDSTFIAH